MHVYYADVNHLYLNSSIMNNPDFAELYESVLSSKKHNLDTIEIVKSDHSSSLHDEDFNEEPLKKDVKSSIFSRHDNSTRGKGKKGNGQKNTGTSTGSGLAFAPDTISQFDHNQNLAAMEKKEYNYFTDLVDDLIKHKIRAEKKLEEEQKKQAIKTLLLHENDDNTKGSILLDHSRNDMHLNRSNKSGNKNVSNNRKALNNNYTHKNNTDDDGEEDDDIVDEDAAEDGKNRISLATLNYMSLHTTIYKNIYLTTSYANSDNVHIVRSKYR